MVTTQNQQITDPIDSIFLLSLDTANTADNSGDDAATLEGC
jgi:hypothetical protein